MDPSIVVFAAPHFDRFPGDYRCKQGPKGLNVNSPVNPFSATSDGTITPIIGGSIRAINDTCLRNGEAYAYASSPVSRHTPLCRGHAPVLPTGKVSIPLIRPFRLVPKI